MKKLLIAGSLVAVVAVAAYNYIENIEDPVPPESEMKKNARKEAAFYEEAEKALVSWEAGRKKNGLELLYEEILKKSIEKLRAENPYTVNMAENVNIAELPLPKEIIAGAEKIPLCNADCFLFEEKKYYAGYYRKERAKTVVFYRETEGGKKVEEIKLEGIKPAALYGFKTIKLTKTGPRILVAMMFANDDSWSIRNYYLENEAGIFVRIFSLEGAWAEERYCDIDNDKVLELIFLKRLIREPEGAAMIVKELREKKLAGFNALFYEHELIKWDEKTGKLSKAGSIIKADFSHK